MGCSINSSKHNMKIPLKEDRTEQVKLDLKELHIEENLSNLKSMSEIQFKEMVKRKMKEMVLDDLNERKMIHSKMDNLFYTDLKTQDYLLSDDTTVKQKRNLFLFRTRMADYNDNFRGGNLPLPCKICKLHLDSQSHSV